jgi:monoamine oxidase
MGFLFSDAPVPTYWTQLPDKTPLLTGWVAGPGAEQLKGRSDPEILDETIHSLSLIFKWNVERLKKEIVASRVINWSADPFSLGAYTYATIDTPKSRKILSAPVDNTLFFAGEALYDGPEMGTVEAALANGRAVAEEINNGLS